MVTLITFMEQNHTEALRQQQQSTSQGRSTSMLHFAAFYVADSTLRSGIYHKKITQTLNINQVNKYIMNREKTKYDYIIFLVFCSNFFIGSDSYKNMPTEPHPVDIINTLFVHSNL